MLITLGEGKKKNEHGIFHLHQPSPPIISDRSLINEFEMAIYSSLKEAPYTFQYMSVLLKAI